jgi:hypothetical protein
MNITDHCARFDESDKSLRAAGSAATEEHRKEFHAAMEAVLHEVDKSMMAMRGPTSLFHHHIGTIAYFNAWLWRRGGTFETAVAAETQDETKIPEHPKVPPLQVANVYYQVPDHGGRSPSRDVLASALRVCKEERDELLSALKALADACENFDGYDAGFGPSLDLAAARAVIEKVSKP